MKLFVALLTLTLFTSCSKIEELEDKTDNMEKATTDMNKKMDKTNETMEGMDANTANLYRQMRQKEAADTRDKEWENLMSKKTDMGQKLTAAKKYFYAFEYQLWTNSGTDTLRVRDHLLLEAIDEFYRMLADEFMRYRGTSPSEIEKASNATKAFYALATTMHFANLDQTLMLEANEGIEEKTMYGIIEDALYKHNAGQELNEYERVVIIGDNEEITRRLLNARLDFITGLALKDMITEDRMSFTDYWWHGALYEVTNGRRGSLRVDSVFEERNVYTQERVVEYLDGALKTKKIMDDNGLKYSLDKRLKSVIKNLSRPRHSDDDVQNEVAEEAYDILDTLVK